MLCDIVSVLYALSFGHLQAKTLQLLAVLITLFLFNFASLILKKTAGLWTHDDTLE